MLFQLAGRGVIPFVFGALFFPMALPGDVGTWAAFLVTLLLAALVSFGIRYLAALSVFWLMDARGVMQALMVTGIFCSGMTLPLNAFPDALGDVVQALPWAAQLQVPADVLMGSPPRSGRSPSRRRGRWHCWRRGGCCSRPLRGGWWCRVGETSRLVDGVRAYLLIAGMWIRAST